MLDKLMITAINRGVLTALCAAINMILVSRSTDILSFNSANIPFQFLSIPNTFWFFIGLLLSSKRKHPPFHLKLSLLTPSFTSPSVQSI